MIVILEYDLYSLQRLADNEDNAPFQIDYLDLGVQAKQLQCIPAAYQCPLLAGETLSSGYKLRDASELRPGLI